MLVPITHETFSYVADHLTTMFKVAKAVRTERWQGKDVSKDPAATTYELMNVSFSVDLHGIEDLDNWREDIKPNLPWADDHFLERVGGEPLNPGVQWAHWPWASSADKFRVEKDRAFNHSYMERLWPKYARRTDGGKLPSIGVKFVDNQKISHSRRYPAQRSDRVPHKGIGHDYGDLQDLVEMLAVEPYTRQAWIPLFFPEDTGVGDGGRKPCTLGYQILVRDARAHIYYPLRSCDFIRHWRDDCYLAVRLLLWIIDRCRELSPAWHDIKPGVYTMHCTSLHIFENDRRALNATDTSRAQV